jgi:glycosyltransferase involved in cell wall biosynthesis
MKMAFVIHSLDRVGGAETILCKYANFFAQEGHNVNIILLSNREVYFDLREEIGLYRFNYHGSKGGISSKINLPYQQIRHIRDSIKKCNPDVVISFISASNILSTIAVNLAKKPIILAERSSYHRALKNRFWKSLRRIVYPFADAAIILTHEDKPKYHYVKKVYVVHNPLVLKQEHSAIKRERLILGVGRLNHIKGFDRLIEAFSKLKRGNWKLLIAGEGKEKANLESLIAEHNLGDSVKLLGLIDDMEYYYKKASLFVLPSRSEGFPGALCEAMGYGCASIAFDCPTGPKEIIQHQKNGILVEADNVKLLAKEMQKLMEDKRKREVLGREASLLANELKIEHIAQQWYEIMQQVISEYKDKR